MRVRFHTVCMWRLSFGLWLWPQFAGPVAVCPIASPPPNAPSVTAQRQLLPDEHTSVCCTRCSFPACQSCVSPAEAGLPYVLVICRPSCFQHVTSAHHAAAAHSDPLLSVIHLAGLAQCSSAHQAKIPSSGVNWRGLHPCSTLSLFRGVVVKKLYRMLSGSLVKDKDVEPFSPAWDLVPGNTPFSAPELIYQSPGLCVCIF